MPRERRTTYELINSVGGRLDYRAAGPSLEASSAVADFGPGLVVMGFAALFALAMSAGLLKPGKPMKVI